MPPRLYRSGFAGIRFEDIDQKSTFLESIGYTRRSADWLLRIETGGPCEPPSGSIVEYNSWRCSVGWLIVVPIISGVNVDLAKFKKVPPTWVRLLAQGEPGFGVVDQVRYIDRTRCSFQIGQLLDFDLKQVENKLKQLLFP